MDLSSRRRRDRADETGQPVSGDRDSQDSTHKPFIPVHCTVIDNTYDPGRMTRLCKVNCLSPNEFSRSLIRSPLTNESVRVKISLTISTQIWFHPYT